MSALTDPLPSAVTPEYRDARNRQVRARIAFARERDGYLAVFLGGTKIHAAVSETRGHSGYIHPRALCQNATSRSYAGEYDPLSDNYPTEVTCERCLASMAKRGI